MKIIDRIREREIVTTNGLGAETHLAIGNTYEHKGKTYRITRHKTWPNVRGILVFGVRV